MFDAHTHMHRGEATHSVVHCGILFKVSFKYLFDGFLKDGRKYRASSKKRELMVHSALRLMHDSELKSRKARLN